MKRNFTLIFLLLLSVFGGCDSATEQQTQATPVVPEAKPAEPEKPQLPNFQVTDVTGKTFTTGELPKNRPTVVIFFHPDCEHCQAEATELQPHLAAFANTNFLMITWDAIPKIKGFMEKYKLTESVTACQIDPTTLAQTYGQLSLPAIFIYNSNQELVQQLNSEARADAILTYLK